MHSPAVELRAGTLPWTDRREWLMPVDDKHTIDWPFTRGSVDVDGVINMAAGHVKQWRTCIQAGGCIGIWPLRLAQYFNHVITFEPQADNYECLAWNTRGVRNITRHRAALGSTRGAVGMRQEGRWVGHSGAWFVAEGGDTPRVRIDDLGLDDVDLICLDLEGYECNALRGAADTINRCRPVISFEDQQHPDRQFYQRYGDTRPAEWLRSEHNYRAVGRGNKDDTVMVPC